MPVAVLIGFVTSAGLIVAIGAQNAFVLRQGLRREHLAVVVLVCAGADALLISSGIAGLGEPFRRYPIAVEVARYAGSAFLLCYGALAVRRALRPAELVADGEDRASLRAVVLTCLAFTFLNPHVYLDTVLMLGNLSTAHGPTGRWWFGAGACAASILWFTGLGYAARLASRWFARPRTWQVLDVTIGIVMFALAAMLLRTAL